MRLYAVFICNFKLFKGLKVALDVGTGYKLAGNDCGLAIGLALIARQAHKPKPNMDTEDEDNN